MARTKVAVIFGGASSEYEVSLKSAYGVLQNIPKDKYEVFPIGITKSGRWLYFPGSFDMIPDGSYKSHPDCVGCAILPDSQQKGIVKFLPGGEIAKVSIDVVFPVLHGKNGEDGTVQGLLTMADIPYVGCDTYSSAACMDKITTKILCERAGIKTAPFLSFMAYDIDRYDDFAARTSKEIGYPCFVKPSNAGSSVGVTKVESEAGLKDAVLLALAHDSRVLVEPEVKGQEVECSVLGNTDLITGVPGEIVADGTFYDYNAKYISGTSELHIPANISESALARVREEAKKAFLTMGCSGISRVDFFVNGEDVVLNEINTLPGFTPISMYPKMLEAAGISYSETVDRLIQLAFERAEM